MEPRGDFLPGDPATHVAGKPEEQPARKHGKLPTRKVTAKHILADIRLRKQELSPLVEEHERLQIGLAAIQHI